jgi:hypothetical protein
MSFTLLDHLLLTNYTVQESRLRDRQRLDQALGRAVAGGPPATITFLKECFEIDSPDVITLEQLCEAVRRILRYTPMKIDEYLLK